MKAENVEKPKKSVQITIVILAVAIVVAISGYCFYSIYESKKIKTEHTAFKKKEIRESDGTWGVVPYQACTVYEDIGLMGLDYKLHDPETNKYACNTSTIDMPSKSGKKTLQYKVSGFAQKATHFSLELNIHDDLNSAESLAARKSWAVYAAVLYTKLFGQAVGEFSEAQMQELVGLSANQPISYYKDGKLLITASVKIKDGVGTYIFNIDGMPNLKF